MVKWCETILNNIIFCTAINILTIYALWGDDIRLMAFNR